MCHNSYGMAAMPVWQEVRFTQQGKVGRGGGGGGGSRGEVYVGGRHCSNAITGMQIITLVWWEGGGGGSHLG